MAYQEVKIDALNAFLKSVLAKQSKISQPAYSNQTALLNSVTKASTLIDLNTNTGTITITSTTGTYTVPQPVINPIIVNTTTSFVSTSDNQVSTTSSGKEDTLTTSNLLNVTNIEDVTNSGYTRNNSILNLYDSISSNYWNPQLSETGDNPLLYKLNYTFDSTGPIYKFAIKNNNDFPGFTNIKLYPTSTPSNYVNITPATDTNNQYVNTSVALLIDQNGNNLFDTNKMTAEFTLEPSIQPNTQYQYGQCYGVMYIGDSLGLRAGNYINTNTGTGNKLQWVTSYLLNQTTLTGTNNTDNNYLVSYDGQYRIAQNRSFYQVSTDGGTTYTQKTLALTSNMKSTSSGQYIIATNTTTGYTSNNYGNSFSSIALRSYYGNYPYFALSYNGQYQMFVSNTTGFGGSSLSINIHKSENYGTSFSEKSIQYTGQPTNSNAYVINTFEQPNGKMIVVSNVLTGGSYSKVYFSSQNAGSLTQVFTNSEPLGSTGPYLSSIDQNYTGNSSTEGQYKTGFGLKDYDGTLGQPSFYVTTDSDSTYIIYNIPSLFPEYYTIVPSLYLGIRNSQVKISSDGSKQIVRVQWYYINTPSLPNFITTYYSTTSGSTWSRSTTFPSLINTFSNIVYNDNFSIVQICGGYSYSYNGQSRTDPVSYISYDYGNNWTLNSAINSASSFVYTNFYSVKTVTNKTYFQIKDLNQNQVLGVSDNGFNMTKDLRVNNHDAYVIGGKMTVGPSSSSGLLNDYDLNVDGILFANNVVLLSDERIKNIIDYEFNDEDAYNKLNELKVSKFNYKNSKNKNDTIGLIAQQVEKIIKDAVDINSSKYITDDGEINITDLYSVDYTTIISYIISSIKHTSKKINELEMKIISKIQTK
jgi:hypothetical protein